MQEYKKVLCRTAVFFSLFLGMMGWAAQTINGATGATTICTWKDNKTAALTLFIDDNNAGEAPFIADACSSRGIKMTWNLETGGAHGPLPDSQCCTWGGNWNLWRSVVAQGHALGSHTITHSCLSDIALDEARVELRDSKAKIEQEVPANGKCITISFPGKAGGCPSSPALRTLTAEYYIANNGDTGEGCCLAQSINLSTNPLDEGFTIFNLYVIGCATADIDALISAGGWANKYWHGLGNCWASNDEFIAYCDYIYNKRALLWTGSVKEVAQYVYERKASTIQLVSANSSQIVLNLTHSLPTNVSDFDFPLTLKTEVEAGWSNVIVMQGSDSTTVQAVTEGVTRYVYFDARPNKGQITLSIGGATAITHGQPGGSGAENKYLQPLYPHPVNAASLYQYLQLKKNLVVCDLTGKVVGGNGPIQPGIYLVRQPDTHGAVQKLCVVK